MEKILESPLDCKEIQPVHPKGNQSWISVGRTDAEAETPILWPPDAKNWHIGKDLDAGKGWRREEMGTTEDEMVGWYLGLDGHEFEQALGAGEGQESRACCSPWGHKRSDTTEWPNWTEHEIEGSSNSVLSPGNTDDAFRFRKRWIFYWQEQLYFLGETASHFWLCRQGEASVLGLGSWYGFEFTFH